MHDFRLRPLTTAFVVCLVYSASFASRPPRPQSPSAARASQTGDYLNESSVIESQRTTVSFAADGTATREDTARIRVQSEGGIEEWGLLSFAFNSANQVVGISYVRVVEPDGSMVTTPLTDVQDVTAEVTSEAPMYSDYREKHVPVKGLGAGDLLEYRVTTRDYKPLVSNQFWFSFDFDKAHIVLDQQLEVRIPRDSSVNVKSPDFKAAVSDDGDQRVYSWKTSNPEHKDWDFLPDWPPPAIQITTFKSWDEVGRWWGALEPTQATVTPEVRARAAELTKDARNDEQKLDAIYSYVATKFRYVSISFGIGRYQPHAAAEVLRNAYGDCKDKQTLLTALLTAAGIAVYPALVNSFRKIDPDVPSPAQFDHVIGVVPQAGNWEWVDTTSEVAPLGFLPSNLREKQVLVIPLKGTPSLVKTPAAPPFNEFQTIEMDGKLGNDGTLECKVQRTARGSAELGLRAQFRQIPQAKWKDIAHAFAYGSSFGGEASDVSATPPEVTRTPFSYSYRFKGQDAPDWAYKRLLIQIPVLGLPNIGDEAKKHEYPIELGPPREISIHWKIELPIGYTPKLLPPVAVSRGFADYRSAYAFKDGTFTLERRLVVKAKEVSPSALEEYRSFQKAVNEDTLAYTYLLTGAESAESVPPNPEAARVIQEAREAYQRQDFKGAVELFERALKTDPQYPAGWLGLGYVQMVSGQRQDSVAAFRKAVELVPKDITARKALASALFGSKADERMQAWRDVLKLDASDRQAHAELGDILLGEKQYGEAARELEAAAVLTTPTSSMQEKIADAYFGALDNGKGVATLQKMAELDPHPAAWNHVRPCLRNTTWVWTKLNNLRRKRSRPRKKERHRRALRNWKRTTFGASRISLTTGIL